MEDSFGIRLRRLRKHYKIKQNELARKLRIHSTWISHIERGRRLPSIQRLIELADYFDVSIDSLLGRRTLRYRR